MSRVFARQDLPQWSSPRRPGTGSNPVTDDVPFGARG